LLQDHAVDLVFLRIKFLDFQKILQLSILLLHMSGEGSIAVWLVFIAT
jgi:hypothetical protein